MIKFLLLLLICSASPAYAAFDQSHAAFSAELSKYVDQSGIHYRQWKEHPEGLDKYLAQLAAITPEEYERFSEPEKKVLWINAYNAIIIRIVLDHYPIQGGKPYYPTDSARQIPSLWEAYRYKVAGREVNLYDIEHKIIRREFKDPRMHFLVVCAARGCPGIGSSAYTASSLERDLEKASWQYMTDPKHVQIDPQHKTVRVSKLFEWFPLDFAPLTGLQPFQVPPPSDDEIVVAYVMNFAGKDVQKQFPDYKDVRVIYMPYDWALNDADQP